MARIKQFILDVGAPLRPVDEAFLEKYLDPVGLELVMRLRKAELLHTIAVAKSVCALLPELASEEARAVVQTALLHDIGKIRYPAGAIEKSLTLLVGRFCKGSPSFLRRWRAWDIRQNHPEYGWEIIREMASFRAYPYLADVIRYHHRPQIFARSYGEAEVRIFDLLRRADDLN